MWYWYLCGLFIRLKIQVHVFGSTFLQLQGALTGTSIFMCLYHVLHTFLSPFCVPISQPTPQPCHTSPSRNLGLKQYSRSVRNHHKITSCRIPNALNTQFRRWIIVKFCKEHGRYHIEAETKWTPFHRRHFEVHFLEWKCLNSDWNFIEVCS